MCAAAGLHADGAGRKRGDQFLQSGARHRRAHQFGPAGLVDSVHRKDVLGEIDADEYDSHGLPLAQVS
jgi:hypothetical protein